MDGQIQVWCGRRRCRNGWEWWQSRLKSGSFLVRVPGFWLCGSAHAHALSWTAGVQQWKSRSCLPLSRFGNSIRGCKDAFLWGQLQGGGHNPCHFPLWHCGLGMHEMAYPSQDSISPSTLDSLAACLLLSEKPFHHRWTSPLLLLGEGGRKKKKKSLAAGHHASLGLSTTLGSLMYYTTPSELEWPLPPSEHTQQTISFPHSPFPILSSSLQVGKHSQSSTRRFLKTARSPYCFEQRGVSAWCQRVRPSNNNNNNNNTPNQPPIFQGGGMPAPLLGPSFRGHLRV